MPTGYRWPDSPNTWEDLRAGFDWTLPDTYNIGSIALDHADQSAPALQHVDGEGAMHDSSYADLDRASKALAARLADAGINRGDRVAVSLPQTPEFLVAYLGVFRLGAQAVPLSVLLGDETVARILRHSEAQAALMDKAKLAQITRAEWPAIENVFAVDIEPENYKHGPSGGLPTRHPESFEGTWPSTDPSEPALVLYTSGTTGQPKGVVQGHQYLAGSLPGYRCYYHLFDESEARQAVVWSPSEWAWAGALFNVVFPTLAMGGTVASKIRRTGFDASGALRFIDRMAVSHAFMPPTALRKIRSDTDPSDHNLSRFEVAQCGGEKLPPSLLEWAEDTLGIIVNEAYGQTEANALIGNCQALFEARPGSIGRPYPGHEVRVVDRDGKPCQPDEIGEITVEPSDPVVFEGYLKNEAATLDKYLEDGLFRTEDMAMVDEEGYFWHQGRKDDLIITSGYRVSPFEVETALEADPAVADAAVVGVPDPETGERIKAFLLLDEGKKVSLEDLYARLRTEIRDELAAFKVPREFEVLDEFPTTTSDKTDRSALLDR